MNPIRILIVDDHPLICVALHTVFGSEHDLQIVGEANDGLEAIERMRTLRPDVVVMDLCMPNYDGLSTMVTARQEHLCAHILVLTNATDEDSVLQAIQAGALGYLTKDARRDELVHAVREVAEGRAYLPPAVSGKLVNVLQRQHHCGTALADPKTAALSEPLTNREHQVLDGLAQGLSNREIATALCVSEGTTRTHVHNILQKLGLRNRSQVILYMTSSLRGSNRSSRRGEASPSSLAGHRFGGDASPIQSGLPLSGNVPRSAIRHGVEVS